MLVMKFGGSSVANAERVRHIAEIIKAHLPQKPVVVLSAMGDTTDHLLDAAGLALKSGKVSINMIRNLHIKTMTGLALKEAAQNDAALLLDELQNLLVGISLIKELTNKTKDYLVSFGERLSVRIMAAYLSSIRIKARAMDAWDAGFITDSGFGGAELVSGSWKNISSSLTPLVESGFLPVVTGFIAKDHEGKITTLGRGGSDLSATTIAAACKAREVQVWKDVDGILTADPRLVKTAQPVKAITYEEAAELAYFGAQVLHPRAMQPCIKTKIPVIVKNSYNPKAPGTRIVAALDKKTGPVRAITSRKNVTLVDIISTRMLGQAGFLEGVFSCFAKRQISVDMVASSEVSISLTLDAGHDLDHLKKDLARIASVDIKSGKAIVTIVGDVRRSSQILAQTFGLCASGGIQVQMVSQGASKVNISFIVNDTEADTVVSGLHKLFFEE